jgi:hypothetical protein
MAASPPAPTPSIEVFFSYAHEDEVLRDALATHLRLLEPQRVIPAGTTAAFPPAVSGPARSTPSYSAPRSSSCW